MVNRKRSSEPRRDVVSGSSALNHSDTDFRVLLFFFFYYETNSKATIIIIIIISKSKYVNHTLRDYTLFCTRVISGTKYTFVEKLEMSMKENRNFDFFFFGYNRSNCINKRKEKSQWSRANYTPRLADDNRIDKEIGFDSSACVHRSAFYTNIFNGSRVYDLQSPSSMQPPHGLESNMSFCFLHAFSTFILYIYIACTKCTLIDPNGFWSVFKHTTKNTKSTRTEIV